MRSSEHRTIGDTATAGAQVNLGGESDEERLVLGYGDVVALSGDFFPAGGRVPEGARREGAQRGAGSATLFEVARVPGEAGSRPGSRDEIICALKVAAVDEAVRDVRFEKGGRFAGLRFSPGADRRAVERRVRDRHLALAASNDDHFVAPGRSTPPPGAAPLRRRSPTDTSTGSPSTRLGVSAIATGTSPGPWRAKRPRSTT